MGWYRIEPETGMPLEGFSSALSQPPDFVLLNAVPDVDDETDACYLGDGPSDMVSTMPSEIATIIGKSTSLSADEVRALFLQSHLPAGVGEEQAAALQHAVAAFWADIDTCYDDDWDRKVLPGEKKWICEQLVERIIRRST